MTIDCSTITLRINWLMSTCLFLHLVRLSVLLLDIFVGYLSRINTLASPHSLVRVCPCKVGIRPAPPTARPPAIQPERLKACRMVLGSQYALPWHRCRISPSDDDVGNNSSRTWGLHHFKLVDTPISWCFLKRNFASVVKV